MSGAFDYSQLASPKGWTRTWAPGSKLSNLFSLYSYHPLANSSGDLTTTGALSIPTALDGPIQVARFRALTANHAVAGSQRCRGLLTLCDTLTMGAAGSISMSALAAYGSRSWDINRDIFIPVSITFTGKNTSFEDFLAWIKSTGYCIFDPLLYACPPPGMGDVQCDWASWTPYGTNILSDSGCGAGGVVNTSGAAFAAGIAGTLAPGGGGTGSGSNGGGKGGNGNIWGGGVGCGTFSYSANVADPYGSYGTTMGGGGVLLVMCRGAVSFTAGASIKANGTNGGTNGGSGGGRSALYYESGSLTGLSNTADAGTSSTGAGGAGVASANTFGVMGW